MINDGLKLPGKRLGALESSSLIAYLESTKKWGFSSTYNNVGPIYRLKENPSVEVLIVESREWGDYANRVADVVIALAHVENRTAGEVLVDLEKTQESLQSPTT